MLQLPAQIEGVALHNAYHGLAYAVLLLFTVCACPSFLTASNYFQDLALFLFLVFLLDEETFFGRLIMCLSPSCYYLRLYIFLPFNHQIGLFFQKYFSKGQQVKRDFFFFLVLIKCFFIFNCFFNSISWFSKLLFSYRRVSNFLVLISIA